MIDCVERMLEVNGDYLGVILVVIAELEVNKLSKPLPLSLIVFLNVYRFAHTIHILYYIELI